MKQVIQNWNGTKTVLAVEDGNLISATLGDAEAIMEDAKARHREGIHGTSEMKHAARVDPVLVERYCNQNGITFHDFCTSQEHKRRFLNDPAISHFRIWPGVV